MTISSIIFLVSLLFSPSPSSGMKEDASIGYDVTKPDAIFILPDILHEISGLTAIDSNSLACIQDELGIIFIYDLEKKVIKNQCRFSHQGDFEDITRVGKELFVLRSDGVLFEIPNYETQETQAISYSVDIPSDNNEGLCYDRSNHRLFITPKGKLGKGAAFKDLRAIFGFDLNSKTLTKKPVVSFYLSGLKRFALDNSITLPQKAKKKKNGTSAKFQFRLSALGIHPLTKKLYVLSAADYSLLILNMNGSIEHIEFLNPQLFNKAEGITFLENGDMFISNEGEKQQPTILRFNYLK